MIARRIRVTGVVQGVGFRPFVWRLAHELGLTGWVRNDAEGVDILAEGLEEGVDSLVRRLRDEAPPLARISVINALALAPTGCVDFSILDSLHGKVGTAIGHDTATCPACLAEMFNPADRRWRHAFITCTNCGPRYTVARRLPYDRAQTSLAQFPLCAACAGEYTDPRDRRFHAETNCCPQCGPRLTLRDRLGRPLPGGDPLALTLQKVRAGEIVAVKGLGGFHLVCDARNPAAVSLLRERKARDEKPFAVLLANLASVDTLAELSEQDSGLLESAERPIVLLRKRPDTDFALSACAPGLAWIGVMLPASPLQFLLFHEAADRPPGHQWLSDVQPLALVCTSANPGGEPLVTGNDEAVERLAGIADAFLVHDRDIVVRCDDSVLRAAPNGSQFVRRARGFTPRAIRLARAGPSVLATGGWFKNTVCVTRDDEAFVSQHIGGLGNAATCEFLEEVVEHLLKILDVTPAMLACDRHPDFHSSRLAAQMAQRFGLPCLPVQHHHAHIAAVLAEHRVEAAVLGLALDGVGLGDDGGAWGGELLRVDGASFRRLSHLRPLQLPGGDRAAREPWRMAASALQALGRGEEIPARFSDLPAAATVAQMLARDISSPLTSSLGRAFDAAAGLLGVRSLISFEGQAAMLLEGLADRHGDVVPPSAAYRIADDGLLDLHPLYAMLADCHDAARGAALFHATLAAGLAEWTLRAARAEGLATVACAGGCFLNHILTRKLTKLLQDSGLRVLLARQLPPNDGGLCLGQAWVAQRSQEI